MQVLLIWCSRWARSYMPSRTRCSASPSCPTRCRTSTRRYISKTSPPSVRSMRFSARSMRSTFPSRWTTAWLRVASKKETRCTLQVTSYYRSRGSCRNLKPREVLQNEVVVRGVVRLVEGGEGHQDEAGFAEARAVHHEEVMVEEVLVEGVMVVHGAAHGAHQEDVGSAAVAEEAAVVFGDRRCLYSIYVSSLPLIQPSCSRYTTNACAILDLLG